jgi:hypothetical protein
LALFAALRAFQSCFVRGLEVRRVGAERMDSGKVVVVERVWPMMGGRAVVSDCFRHVGLWA